MKKFILPFLAAMPIALSSCANSGYTRCNTITIGGITSVSNVEPIEYLIGIYESSISMPDTKEYPSATKGYGNDRNLIYIMAAKAGENSVDLRDEATLRYRAYDYSSTLTTTATLVDRVAMVHNSTEVYYSQKNRTVKVKEDKYMPDKKYNASEFDNIEDKTTYTAYILGNTMTIDGVSSGMVFESKSEESFVDLGSAYVMYTPYTPPKNK